MSKRRTNEKRREEKRRVNYALISVYFLAFIVLSVNSLNSFLYFTNTWGDTMATWVLSKSMFFDHQILYKDIFDQRGIVLYVIYGIGAILSSVIATKTSLIGLFIIEYLALVVHLIFAKKIIECFDIKHKYLTLVAAVFIFTDIYQGGSPEELLSPLITILLYLMLRYIVKGYQIKGVDYFIQGLFLGLAFWTKFSFIGFWLGFFLYIGVNLSINRKFRELFSAIITSLLGFLTVSIPALFYFIRNSSLSNLFYNYWTLNTQYYRPKASKINTIMNISNNFMTDWFTNPYEFLFFVFIIIGIITLARKYNVSVLLASLFIGVSGVYFGYQATGFGYYYFIFHSFIWLGMVMGLWILEEKYPQMNRHLTSVIGILLVIFSLRATPVTIQSIQQVQDIKAKIIQHNQDSQITLLQYDGLETGFYNQLNVNPNVKYFLQTNIVQEQFPQMPLERLRYMADKKTEFVIYNVKNTALDKFPLLPKSILTKTTSQIYINKYGNSLTATVPQVLVNNYKLIYNNGDYLIYQRK